VETIGSGATNAETARLAVWSYALDSSKHSLVAMRIAVLSDVHAHADAFEAALAAARIEGFDAMLILGDLLTYGVAPQRTLDLTRNALDRDGAVLILGNHDQLYLDLEGVGSSYSASLPDWIRESIDWTRDQLVGSLADREFAWRKSWESGRLFAAHANPYPYGDWTYLSSSAEVNRAAQALAEGGHRWGLFGHTHRFLHQTSADGLTVIATVGSLGQPRDPAMCISQWAMVTVSDSSFEIMPRAVPCDWRSHMAAIEATSLSKATQERLCRFFWR
jgi:predicted phosphodiesterase